MIWYDMIDYMIQHMAAMWMASKKKWNKSTEFLYTVSAETRKQQAALTVEFMACEHAITTQWRNEMYGFLCKFQYAD
jgi:hypothetical protein